MTATTRDGAMLPFQACLHRLVPEMVRRSGLYLTEETITTMTTFLRHLSHHCKENEFEYHVPTVLLV
jgi:hypothetical protein